MQNIADKADSTAGSTGELTASEYNNHKNELQGAVTRSGQTLSAAVSLQLAKAMFINGIGANTAQDGGSLNSILLSPPSGSSGLVVPDAYSHFNGGILVFTKSDSNTSTSVTVNFGQTGTELGAKSLKRSDGSNLVAGEVTGLLTIQWNNSENEWRIIDSEYSRGLKSNPIGSTYIQFPGDDSPAALGLPGTWSNVSSDLSGNFIRFEGTNASDFESGQQTNQNQNATGNFNVRTGELNALTIPTATGVFSKASISTTYVPIDIVGESVAGERVVFDLGGGTEARPNNRTVRKWRRTA